MNSLLTKWHLSNCRSEDGQTCDGKVVVRKDLVWIISHNWTGNTITTNLNSMGVFASVENSWVPPFLSLKARVTIIILER